MARLKIFFEEHVELLVKISLALSFQSVFFRGLKVKLDPCGAESLARAQVDERRGWHGLFDAFSWKILNFFWNLGHFFPALLQKTDLVRTLVVENYSLAKFELNCRIIFLHCSLILFCQVTLGRIASLCSIFKYFLSGLEMSRHCGLSWVSLQNNDFVCSAEKFFNSIFFYFSSCSFFSFSRNFPWRADVNTTWWDN